MFCSRICEYYSHALTNSNSSLVKYNRSTGIEIRGISEVPEVCKKNLEQYGYILYGPNIPVFVEDVNLINELDKIAVREIIPSPCDGDVKMIIFCSMMCINTLLSNSMWITNSLDISIDSWYVNGFSQDIKHTLFCGDECYHINLDIKMENRKQKWLNWKEEELKKT